MSVFSFQFVFGALFLATVFFYLPGLFLRRLLFATCNVGFIWLCLPNYQSWIVLGAFVVSGYLVGVLLRHCQALESLQLTFCCWWPHSWSARSTSSFSHCCRFGCGTTRSLPSA